MAIERAILHRIDEQSTSRRLDEAIAVLAGRQHGIVARWQLEALGLGRGAIDLRIAAGRLHRVHAGVYAVGHRVLSQRGRWTAAVLAAGEDAVLRHRAAARLRGVPRSSALEVT